MPQMRSEEVKEFLIVVNKGYGVILGLEFLFRRTNFGSQLRFCLANHLHFATVVELQSVGCQGCCLCFRVFKIHLHF